MGGKAQLKMLMQVAGSLKQDLAQYRELAAFTQFGSDLDEATQKQLNRGDKMVELLKQGQYVPMPEAKQVMMIWVGTKGYLDDIPSDAIGKFEEEFFAFCEREYPEIELNLDKEKVISESTDAKLKEATEKFKTQFKPGK